MKKFLTICVLLLVAVVGAKADITLNPDVRFYTKVTSTDGTNTSSVTVSVNKDYVGTVVLPAKNDEIYCKKVTIETAVQDVAGLGITGVKSATKTVESSSTETRVLYDLMPNVYDFTGEKYVTVQVGTLDKVKFTITKETKANSVVLTAVPDSKENAQLAWSEICKHMTSATTETEGYKFFVAKGSLFQNDNEYVTFNSDFTSTRGNFAQNLTDLKAATSLSTCTSTGGMYGVLSPTSYAQIGSTTITLNDACYASVDGLCMKSGFLADVKKEVNDILALSSDTEQKKEAIKFMLDKLKEADEQLAGKDEVNFKLWFNTPEEPLDKDVRFYTKVTSTDGTNTSSVTVSVNKDYVGTVVLPAKNDEIYCKKVTIETAVQDVAGLGITGVKSATKTVESSSTETRVLYDLMPNVYDFTGEKYVTVQVANLDTVKFVITKETKANGAVVITATPTDESKDYAKKAWSEICNHLEKTTSSSESKDYKFFVAKGSLFQSDNEYIKFSEDFESTRNGFKENLSNFQAKTALSSCTSTSGMYGVMKAGSYVTIGNTTVTLKDSCYASVDGLCMKSGFLTDVKKKVDDILALSSDTEQKKEAIKFMLDKLKEADEQLAGKDEVNFKLWFNKGDVNQDGIVDVTDVSCSVYIVNGKNPATLKLNKYAADMDDDCTLSVSDINTLSEKIIEK